MLPRYFTWFIKKSPQPRHECRINRLHGLPHSKEVNHLNLTWAKLKLLCSCHCSGNLSKWINDKPYMGIDRKSSIEKEPRTLTVDQIQYAREAALYVLNTRSIEEAMSVFTEGLEPVGSGRMDNMMDISEEMNYVEDGMRSPGLRDIVSAPF